MDLADRVQGRSVTIGVQDGAKAGASLLANLLERDLVRGGAARSCASEKVIFSCAFAQGARLEEAPLSDGVEITARTMRTFAWSMGEDALQEVNLRIQKIEPRTAEAFGPRSRTSLRTPDRGAPLEKTTLRKRPLGAMTGERMHALSVVRERARRGTGAPRRTAVPKSERPRSEPARRKSGRAERRRRRKEASGRRASP